MVEKLAFDLEDKRSYQFSLEILSFGHSGFYFYFNSAQELSESPPFITPQSARSLTCYHFLLDLKKSIDDSYKNFDSFLHT